MTAQALAMPKGAWVDVGAPDDIPLRGARRIATPDGDIAIFRAGDGRIFALRDAWQAPARPRSDCRRN